MSPQEPSAAVEDVAPTEEAAVAEAPAPELAEEAISVETIEEPKSVSLVVSDKTSRSMSSPAVLLSR